MESHDEYINFFSLALYVFFIHCYVRPIHATGFHGEFLLLYNYTVFYLFMLCKKKKNQFHKQLFYYYHLFSMG